MQGREAAPRRQEPELSDAASVEEKAQGTRAATCPRRKPSPVVWGPVLAVRLQAGEGMTTDKGKRHSRPGEGGAAWQGEGPWRPLLLVAQPGTCVDGLQISKCDSPPPLVYLHLYLFYWSLAVPVACRSCPGQGWKPTGSFPTRPPGNSTTPAQKLLCPPPSQGPQSCPRGRRSLQTQASAACSRTQACKGRVTG